MPLSYPKKYWQKLQEGKFTTPLFIAAALIIFLLEVISVFIVKENSFDQKVIDSLSSSITDTRTRLMIFISFFGNHSFLIPANFLLIFYFLFRKNKWDALRVAIVALSSLGLMSLLKNLFQRHRPAAPLVEGITNYSFPSGHAFMSMAFYGLLIYFIRHNLKAGWLRTVIILLTALLIFLIGFSRIYLRVHYTSDVVAGFSMGIAWLLFVLLAMDHFKTLNLAKK